MKKKSKKVLTLLLSVTILCSCENFKVNQAGDFGENSTVSESVINSESENVASESAVNSEDYPERSERESKKKMEQASADSYNYWKKLLNNEYDRVEIDFIVNWLKDREYIKSLSFYSDGSIDSNPNNKRTEKRIQSEDGFTRVRDYLKKEDLAVVNCWLSNKDYKKYLIPKRRIEFFHNFSIETVSGDYCLVYAGSELSKGEEDMDKITGNYYEKVLFYR